MGLRNPPYTVRLPGELGRKFNRLRQEFQGLPPSTLLRFLIAHQLARPLDEQAEVVVSQIRGTPTPLRRTGVSRNSKTNSQSGN